MIKNYLKIAIRNLQRHRGYTFINITGLALGLATCMLLFLYVQDELNYDLHNEHVDRVYRVGMDAAIGGMEFRSATTSAPMAATIREEYPEIEQSARIWPADRVLIEYETNRFYEDNFYWADSTVFDILTIPLVQGEAHSALVRPNTVVMSRSMAEKYFGSANPLGRQLRFDNRDEYEVTGVFDDLPTSSHVHLDFIGSLMTHERSRSPIWVSNSFYTYILLREGASAVELEAKFPDLVRKYVAPQIEQAVGKSFDEVVASGAHYDFILQPLRDVYLRSDLENDVATTSDIRYVYLMSAVGLFILLLACINFMNLATARSANRAKEVGLRKVLGSERRQLVWQFLGESVFLALSAYLVALVLLEIALPFFNDTAGKALATGMSGNFEVWGILLLISLLAGLLAGIYPAFVLSSFKPVTVLKGTFSSGAKNSRLRNVLVVLQFSITIILLIGTGIVVNQLNFMQNKDLGFTKEQVVVLPIETDEGRRGFERFRQQLLANPAVVSVGGSDSLPGRFTDDTVFRPEGASNETVYPISVADVSFDFLETLEIEPVAGRLFSRSFPSDSVDGIVINETAVQRMGLSMEEVVGMRLTRLGNGQDIEDLHYRIVGVVRDFHFSSLHQPIRPVAMMVTDELSYISARVQPENLASTLSFLEESWTAYESGHPYRYFFLDQDFGRLYVQEQRLSTILGYFTLLAVIIACLGLFGLASFVTQQRTTEIGVRKVLGASVRQIVIMLSASFARLVLIALVVAVPVAYLMAGSWLENFAYRIDIPWWIFIAAGLAALVIALLTVSYQSVRAAIADPVKSLRYE